MEELKLLPVKISIFQFLNLSIIIRDDASEDGNRCVAAV